MEAVSAIIWEQDVLQLGKICIWCTGSTDKTDLSHVLPVSLGNTEQILSKGIVCKSCNRSFGRKIEPALEVVASFRWRNDGSHRPGWQAPGAYAGEAIRKMRGMASQHAGQVCA